MKSTFSETATTNAGVCIDYTKGRVDFKYADGKRVELKTIFFYSCAWYWKTFSTPLILSGLIISIEYAPLGAYAWPAIAILPPAIAALWIWSHYDKWQALWPKFVTGNPQMIYTKTVRSLDTNMFEVPVFDGTYLHYECIGEFARNLQKVTTEHLDYLLIDRRNKEHINDQLCKVIFPFSSPPKSGRLTVDFPW